MPGAGFNEQVLAGVQPPLARWLHWLELHPAHLPAAPSSQILPLGLGGPGSHAPGDAGGSDRTGKPTDMASLPELRSQETGKHFPYTGSQTSSQWCWGVNQEAIGEFILFYFFYLDFPSGTSGKEPACQCTGCKRHRFDP